MSPEVREVKERKGKERKGRKEGGGNLLFMVFGRKEGLDYMKEGRKGGKKGRRE
jgi:hypothetical protein